MAGRVGRTCIGARCDAAGDFSPEKGGAVIEPGTDSAALSAVPKIDAYLREIVERAP